MQVRKLDQDTNLAAAIGAGAGLTLAAASNLHHAVQKAASKLTAGLCGGYKWQLTQLAAQLPHDSVVGMQIATPITDTVAFQVHVDGQVVMLPTEILCLVCWATEARKLAERNAMGGNSKTSHAYFLICKKAEWILKSSDQITDETLKLFGV